MVRPTTANLWPSSVSPDGRYLVYEATQGTHSFVGVKGFGADTSSRTLFDTETGIGQTRFSPDGHRIVYTSGESGRPEIYVTNFDGTPARWQISTAGGLDAQWAPSGREIYYLSPDQKLMSVPIAPGAEFSPGMPVEMFPMRFDASVRNNYVVAPDNQRFLFLVPESDQNWPMTVVVNWEKAP